MPPTIFTPDAASSSPFAKHVAILDPTRSSPTVAKNNGKVYTGKTIIHLKGTVMDVTNYDSGGPVTTHHVALPANGVLYVNAEGSCNGPDSGRRHYDESTPAAATSTSAAPSPTSLTIAARHDVIVRPTIGAVLDRVLERRGISCCVRPDADARPDRR